MAKKSILSNLISDSPESIIAAAEEVEKEITRGSHDENEKNQSTNHLLAETKSQDDDEAPVFDVDYFFNEISGKKIEYRPSLMSAEFLDRIKYLSIVFQVPMKDITYNICNYWWETFGKEVQKAVKKRKKDFI